MHPRESVFCCKAKDTGVLDADSDDSDKTVWKHRLNLTFAGGKYHCLGFVVQRLD